MLGKFIAGDFIAIAGEMRRFPASNENTLLPVFILFRLLQRINICNDRRLKN
jgi:hypothetical protein